MDPKSIAFDLAGQPSQPILQIDTNQSIDTILKIRGLSNTTIKSYKTCYNLFKKSTGRNPITKEVIQEYWLNNPNKRNNLALFRLLYPELSRDIKFPKKQWAPKILPNKYQLRVFYDVLPNREKIIFLLLAESGLRINELLSSEIDTSKKMLVPKGHNGQTKHSYISFYRTNVKEIPEPNLRKIIGFNQTF